MSAAKSPKSFAMTGIPRSGTTYLCSVLYHPPDVITISEASGEWKRGFQQYGRSARVLDLFEVYRERILRGEPVATFEGTAGFRGEGRVDTWNQEKEIRRLEAKPDFALGMKNPAVFLELLDAFKELGIPCVISVRHPVAVLNSWVKRVRGRVERGASIGGTFAHGDSIGYSSALIDPLDRRIDLHNHFALTIIAHRSDPNVLIVRYEDWFTDSTQLERVARFLDIAHRGSLRPKPSLPDPPDLPAEEQEKILRECAIAGEYGYPMEGERLGPLVAGALTSR